MEGGDYSVRIGPNDGMRSVRQLTSGFNTMTARLEADEAQRRALLADVSHELRTPLTVISGNLEAILDGVYPADEAHLAPILDQTQVMARLIDDLRTLTLSEAGTLALHREPTAVDLVIAEVVRSFGAAATAAGVTLTDATTDDLPILDVDPVRIREVLTNLVANALRHTPAGGTVTVTGSHSPDARLVTMRVTRHRPGHRPRPAPLRLRPLRQGRDVTRVRPGPRDRPRPRGGPRRPDLGGVHARCGRHVHGRAADRRYGQLSRPSTGA